MIGNRNRVSLHRGCRGFESLIAHSMNPLTAIVNGLFCLTAAIKRETNLGNRNNGIVCKDGQLARCGGVSGLLCDNRGRVALRRDPVDRAAITAGPTAAPPRVFHRQSLRDSAEGRRIGAIHLIVRPNPKFKSQRLFLKWVASILVYVGEALRALPN